MKRHPTYDEKLARELRNQKFAAEYFLTLMEGSDGLELLEALKHAIQRMGIKEFAKKAKIHPKSVSRMLASEAFPKFDTLNQYLSPFGLQVKITAEPKAA